MISDNVSMASDCNSVLSSQRRIMKVRTLNESLREQTKDQLESAQIRRSLRLNGLSVDDEVDVSTLDTDRILTVTFNTVKVREYPIILGDNPSVSEGPPLSIDWVYIDVDEFDVEEYETTRPSRRGTPEMNIPASIRIDTLKRSGFTTKDIYQRVKEVKQVKQRRLETTTMLYRSDMNENIEKTKRRFSNIFSKKKKKERQLIEASMESMNVQRAAADNQAQMEEEALAVLVNASQHGKSGSEEDQD
mmetsp:Transcript_1480/g.1592  ORF Transcript_1480/g.1592 Transcript_1480/m.1592 type:complete len:247 (+) Transcript_1480:124-864(+)